MKVTPRSKALPSGEIRKDYVVTMPMVAGKRGMTRVFTTREAADTFLSEQKEKKRDHGNAALAILPATAQRYAAVEARLVSRGATIEQAADFYLEHHKPVKEHITLGDLLDRCVLDMELRKVRGHSISTFACACRSFIAGRTTRDPASVTRDEIREWIYGNGWEPKTQRSYLQSIGQLLDWAVERELLAHSPLQRGAIKLPKLKRKDPEIFTTHQLVRLFRTAMSKHEFGEDPHSGERKQLPVYRRLLGFLALATFGGIRPFELTRLEVTAIDVDARTATLDGDVTKTSDRRVVDLSDNTIAWLRIWQTEFPQHEKAAPPSWDRLMKQLRKASGLIPWPHDVLRHCFASYYHAKHRDKAALQAQMGHSESEDTLDRHYRAVRGPDGRPINAQTAEQFWKITPTSVMNSAERADREPTAE